MPVLVGCTWLRRETFVRMFAQRLPRFVVLCFTMEVVMTSILLHTFVKAMEAITLDRTTPREKVNA
jgi:hypothetical protein